MTPIKMSLCRYSLSWSTGTVFGSVIPNSFKRISGRSLVGRLEMLRHGTRNIFSWPLFMNHPYLPSCIMSALCTLLGRGLVYLLIKEVCIA